jgi:hypothetical protein
MHPAVCFFIKKLAHSGLFKSTLVAHDEKFLAECELFIRECIELDDKEVVQLAACQTLPYCCDIKFAGRSNQSGGELIQSYLHCMKATSKEYVRLLPDVFKDGQNFARIYRALIQESQTIFGLISENSNNTLKVS